jgi:hypothetical protein
MEPRRAGYQFARVRLAWTDVAGGSRQAQEQSVLIQLEQDSTALRNSGNPAVIRSAIDIVISEGLQDAIEEMDKGDMRRALRALRRARGEALDLNYRLDDPRARASIAELDAYLDQLKGRGLNQLDRKILRSGLNRRFQTPMAGEEPAK